MTDTFWRRIRPAILLAGICVALARPAAAQAPYLDGWSDPQPVSRLVGPRAVAFDQGSAIGHAIGLGLVGAAAGFGLAAYADVEDPATLIYSVLGGATVGIPLGVWTSDSFRGNPGNPLAASVALWFVAFAFGASVPPLLVVVPPLQIAASIRLQAAR